MAESLFASLLHSLDKGSTFQIATALGESEHGVSRGLEASVAAVLGAMASKSNDPAALRRILDLVPESAGDVSWSKLASGLSGPVSPWIHQGKQMLCSLFGANSNAISTIVGVESGVAAGTATTLLSMAAPMVLRGLGKRVRDEGLSMRSLETILQRESAAISPALPAGVGELLWPQGTVFSASSPVVAQSVHRETSSAGWLGALAMAAFAVGALWLWSYAHRPTIRIGPAATGEANRLVDEADRLGGPAKRKVHRDLTSPANGVEAQLVGLANGTVSTGPSASWLEFGRLRFDSGSSELSRDSSGQLDSIAAILKSYPDVRLRLAGFTDNVGTARQNLEISLARAESVKAELVARGISPDRLVTQGFGNQFPSADNSTPAGRASNRKVLVQVTQK